MSASNALTVTARTAAWPADAPPAPRTAPGLAALPIRTDASCAVGAMLAAWTISSALLPLTDPGRSVAVYWLGGILGGLGVVGSLLVHAVGRVAAARTVGSEVGTITLSFAGGHWDVDAHRDGRHGVAVAVAGAASWALAALAAATLHVVLVETVGPGVPATVAALVAAANLILLALNLIPARPLDGGYLAHGLVWLVTGRAAAATRAVTALGRRLGDAFGVVGVLASAFGEVGPALWALFLGLALRLGGEPEVSERRATAPTAARRRRRRGGWRT